MSLVTIEVAIENGRIIPSEPVQLPTHGNGLLTILQSNESGSIDAQRRERIQLPLIEGEPGEIVNPTREELDASFWG